MLTDLKEWHDLIRHYARIKNLQLRKIFSSDEHRGQRMLLTAAGWLLDYSKNRVTDETMQKLYALAKACKLKATASNTVPIF